MLNTTTLNRVQSSEARSRSETFGSTSEGRNNFRNNFLFTERKQHEKCSLYKPIAIYNNFTLLEELKNTYCEYVRESDAIVGSIASRCLEKEFASLPRTQEECEQTRKRGANLTYLTHRCNSVNNRNLPLGDMGSLIPLGSRRMRVNVSFSLFVLKEKEKKANVSTS